MLTLHHQDKMRCVAFWLLAIACLAAGAIHADVADVVLSNGVIYTHNAASSIVHAVAIKDGRFVYVGDDAGVVPYIGPATMVTNLAGHMAMPGFIDSHLHPTMSVAIGGGAVVTGENVQAYLQCIKQYYAANPGLKLLMGMGWDDPAVPPSGPTSKELDTVVSNIPAVIYSEDGHSMWLNTLAMQTSGLAKLKHDPPGGRIEREPRTRTPRGTIREWGAEYLVMQIFDKMTAEQYLEPLKERFAWMNAVGITTVHDAALMPGPSLAALDMLAQRGQLTMRVRGALFVLPFAKAKDVDATIAALVQEKNKHTNELFKVQAVKFLMDGVIEGRTALLQAPYLTDKPKQKGLQMWRQQLLKKLVHAAHKAGFQTHFHAIGDRATRLALDALQFSARHGGGDHRDLITHLELVRPVDIPRFAALKVIAVPQPQWFYIDSLYYPVVQQLIGIERAAHQYPMRSFLDAGVMLASASDFPASVDPSPLLSIQGGILRWLPDSGDNPPLWPEECVGLDDILASFTVNGAYANFLENETGSIEVGKAADLVVLSDNLHTIDPKKIYDTKVLMTFLCGKLVYALAP